MEKIGNFNWPNRSLFVLFSFIAIVVWALYLRWIDVGVLLSDQIPWIYEYNNLLDRNLSWSDLWEAKGGHRLPGYKVLFYLNTLFFGFSPFLENMTAVIPFSIAATFVSIKFAEEVDFSFGLKVLIFAAFWLLFLNAQVFRLSNYSLISTQLFDYVGFLIVLLMTFRICFDSEEVNLKNWVAYLAIVIFFILIFGRGYGVGASASIFCISFVGLLHFKDKKFLAIMLIVFLMIPIYLVGISSDGSAATQKLDILALLKYMCLKLGNAYVGMVNTPISENRHLAMAVGAIVFTLKGIIGIRALQGKYLSKMDLLALFFILMSLFSLLLVSVLRYDQSPFYPRHNLEVSLGSIGVLYFLLRLVSDITKTKIVKIGVTVSISLLLVSLVANHFSNLRNSVYVKKYYENIEKLQTEAYNATDPLSQKTYNDMQCMMNTTNCFEVFEIMKDHGISKDILDNR